MVYDVTNDRVNIVLSHGKTSDELTAASDLAASLRDGGESTGAAMQTKDGLGDPSVMDSLIWFIKHPETIDVSKAIFAGTSLILIDRWVRGGSGRVLRIEYGDYKVEAKNVKELEAAIKLLPPPSKSQVLEDGDRMVNGEIVPDAKS